MSASNRKPATYSRIGAGEWLSTAVHELMQPLNRMRVAAQEARIDAREGRVDLYALSQSMLEIEGDVDRLTSLLERLHRFATPCEDAWPTVHGEDDAAEVADVCRAVMACARARFPQLSVTDDLETGLLIPGRALIMMERALWELVRNGVESANEAGRAEPQLSLRARRRGADAVVSLIDNGCGLRPAQFATAAKPFFTTRSAAPGMGLAYASAVVAELGGNLTIARSDASGSELELAIPLWIAPPDAARRAP